MTNAGDSRLSPAETTRTIIEVLYCVFQAEEVKLLGIDSLGFDLRLCAGAKIESLRFAFLTRATSEDDAEGQIRELLFPTINPSEPQEPKQTSQKEC